jgi:hypothetical protein
MPEAELKITNIKRQITNNIQYSKFNVQIAKARWICFLGICFLEFFRQIPDAGY